MLMKNQASSIISTYTADVSGVCSALFELGGMCIMHDASGCNSTYNTHDEPRWYNTDSLVFISGLSEMEAIMGDDKKLAGDIIEACRELSPKFVAIAGTPIPTMIGTDLDAIAGEVEDETGIPAFAVNTTGMNSYLFGAGLAFEKIVRLFARDTEKTQELSANILGTTPLDFSVNGYTGDMYELIEKSGFHIISRLGMGGSLSDIEKMGAAHVNLVVSSCGLLAARYLKEKFGTPYVIGTPVKGFDVTDALKKAAQNGESGRAYERCGKNDGTFIIGEAVTAASLAASGVYGNGARVISPPNTDPECGADFVITGENELIEILKDAEKVIADPLFAPICPKSAEFIPFAHEAFSGRIYREQIKNLLK